MTTSNHPKTMNIPPHDPGKTHDGMTNGQRVLIGEVAISAPVNRWDADDFMEYREEIRKTENHKTREETGKF